MTETDLPDSHRESFWRFYRLNFRLHIVFLLMAAAVITCSFVMSSEGKTTVRMPGVPVQMPSTCMSKRIWGVDCPGCGLTRSFISMSHAQFGRAFSFNPAGPLVYLFVLFQIPWHLYQMFRLWKLRRPIETLWLYVPLFAMSGAILIQWLWRLARGDLF
ncbi:DUF2752 domain-containing protein [Mariniblastus fucicola]|uniref:DUF2752 domain-containing protein n=1 Tax=Mariniblastus fucicola TaxID=980251 RepID=A0A5B9PGB5_9BACT|nr:DUF2752 domain-containing protein [Mariniblastus fucicola]QEG24290.1 hypothetical protein MFFC18_42080 [Mariniblastus fucicola]